MKILLVTGGDFARVKFEDVWGGTSVSDIISNTFNYEPTPEQVDNDLFWDLEVHEFGDICPEFAKFVRKDFQEYDDSKEKTFYLETETV